MIVKNTPIAVTWVLSKTATVYTATQIDLSVSGPDNISVYSQGSSNWSDSFLAPTADTDGFITNEFTFAAAGLYRILLTDGSAASHTVLSENLMQVIEGDVAQSLRVNLP